MCVANQLFGAAKFSTCTCQFSRRAMAAEPTPFEQAAVELVERVMDEKDKGKTQSAMLEEIDHLAGIAKAKKAERTAANNALRNAKRKKDRLKHKARLLTATELHEVINLRSAEDERKAKEPKRDTSLQPTVVPGGVIQKPEPLPLSSTSSQPSGENAPEAADQDLLDSQRD